jgi:exopolyphosphatase/guanosine-5'-triphosphate,3'-diphosphate pyrophosphatase
VRLAVLDVGSNTVHLLVVDAHEGARPLPAHSDKAELRLAEHLTNDGLIDDTGQSRLIECVQHALEVAEDRGTEDLVAFATSALRDAPNGPEVLAAVRDETGVDLEVLTGNDEARLTFLAVRRWFGWSSGRLMVIDIGGGSLELAAGIDELPDAVASLPLGAGRLTRTMLPGDPPSGSDVKALRKHVGRRWPASCARSRRSARPTTWSARPRRSSSWPGWPGRRCRGRANAFLGCSAWPTSTSGCRSLPR